MYMLSLQRLHLLNLPANKKAYEKCIEIREEQGIKMTNLEIIMAIVIVGLSIVMPIYYSLRKKLERIKRGKRSF